MDLCLHGPFLVFLTIQSKFTLLFSFSQPHIIQTIGLSVCVIKNKLQSSVSCDAFPLKLSAHIHPKFTYWDMLHHTPLIPAICISAFYATQNVPNVLSEVLQILNLKCKLILLQLCVPPPDFPRNVLYS